MPIILRPTITETFLERVRLTPGLAGFSFKPRNAAIGPVDAWKQVSFREFHQECEKLAHAMRIHGVRPGDRVAILSSTRYEWSVCDLAVLGARAVTVPVYASLSAKETLHLLRHSESSLVFVENAEQLAKIYRETGPGGGNALPSLRRIVVLNPEAMRLVDSRADLSLFSDFLAEGERAMRDAPNWFDENLQAASPDDLITICYTSGTTGTPKGAMLTHANLMSVLEDCARLFERHIQPDREQLLTFLPFSHIIGKVESMATFVFGWNMGFAESVEKVGANFREVRPTLLFAVPRIFEKAQARILGELKAASAPQRRLFHWAFSSGERFFQRQWTGRKPRAADSIGYHLLRNFVLERVKEGFGGRLRMAICGGAPLPKELGEYFRILGVRIFEGYGLTETCAPVAMNTPDALKFGTVGKPLPELQLKIADDGEILLKSKKLFRGYYRDEAATREAFDEDGWYRTGDVGFLDPQGYLHITDRKKDLIITSGGKNVAPQKIEAEAKALSPLISEFVVIGDRKKYLAALVVLERAEVEAFARREHILYSGFDQLTQHAKVLAQIERIVGALNEGLSRFETIKRFMILPTQFSIETGELTPSLKVRRGMILKKYRDEIEALYDEDAVETPPKPSIQA